MPFHSFFQSVRANNSSRISCNRLKATFLIRSRAGFSLAALQVLAVRFTNLGDFVSQLFDAFFDGILHQPRLAEHKAPEFYLEVKPWARATESCTKSFAAYGTSVSPLSPGGR